jgi:hypothetical protein
MKSNLALKKGLICMQLAITSLRPKMGKERHLMQVRVKGQQTAA